MMTAELTDSRHAATTRAMRGRSTGARGSRWIALLLLAGTALIGGCVNVTAPSEPIVIELNINIRQEVIYRLAADAGNTIDENEDIF